MERSVGFTQCARYTCLEDLQQAVNFSGMNGINLDYCGEEKCEPGYRFGPFIRENYVIHIVLEGKGTYQLEGKSHSIGENQAFLIYPGKETIYQADKKEPWHYMWIGFHGYRSEELLRNMGFSAECPVLGIRNTAAVKENMSRMLAARKLSVKDELTRMSRLLDILALLMENNEKDAGEEKRDYPGAVYARYAADYMQIHFKEKIKIDDIAEIIGISRSYLTGNFKKELGLSPQEYLINLRMEYAAELLHETADPVNRVAEEAGYEDSLSFSKAFKQKFGVSPKEFRNAKVEVVNKEEKGGYIGKYPL